MLARLKEEYRDRVVFLSLTVEPTDTPEKIAEKFSAAPGLHYARASDTAWAKLMEMGGTKQVVPTHAFIKSDGTLAETIVGASGVEEAVKRLAQ